MNLSRKFNLQLPGPKLAHRPLKGHNLRLYVASVIKQSIWEGHILRLYVTVVATKLLLGNFGYKAV
jgi:hypothetical protein